MKHTKQWIALLLAVVMTAALLSVPAFAKAPNDLGIETYVALGDSIATGLNDNTGTNEDAYGSWANGYTVRLAEKLGLITDETPSYVPDGYDCVYYTSPNEGGFRSWAFPAMRTREILQQVDPTYEYERDRFAEYWLDNGELNEQLGDVPALIQADVKDADLITLNIGSNDVVLAQLRNTAWEIEDEVGVGASAIIDLMKSKLGFADAPTLPEGTDENAIVMKFLPLFLKNVMKGYNEFLQNMPKILKALRAQNPTAQIVVIGVFNPVHYSLSLTDNKLPITLGEMLDGVMTPLNAALANCCMRYRCTYVDVVDEPVDGSMHPTNEGYLDIANRIYAKLKYHPTETGFTDTDALSAEFQNAINWAVAAGVTNGFPDGTFQPEKICTRSEIVTLLWRMAGEPEASAPAAFEDVTEDWYAEAVAWAAENGITNGTSETKFSPDQTCTRGQIVTFLYRYDRLVNAEAGETAAASTFRDVSPAAYYGAPVTWAVKNGITKGISSVLFAPLQSCNRVQSVTFLFRYSQL